MSFIPKAKDELDPLEREKRNIENRRKFEAERKKRIFNDKQRTMGLDLEYIKKQVQEKKEKKQKEIDEDKNYKKKMDSFVDTLEKNHEKLNKIRKYKTIETGLYQKNTKKEMSDTWDINDPTLNRTTKPPRMDDKQAIHVSSLQKFDGEDLEIKNRVKKQQNDLQNWFNIQIKEKKDIKNKENIQMNEYIKKRNENLNKLNEIEKNKKINNLNKKREIFNENKKIIESKLQNINNKTSENAKMCENEINYLNKTNLLTENYDSTLRIDNKNRFIPYNFKGFNKEYKQNILNQQLKQIEQNKQNKINEKLNDKNYQNQFLDYQRKVILQQRKLNRDKLVKNNKLANYHQSQIKQYIKNQDNINKLYSNQITNQFFDQFQTTTR